MTPNKLDANCYTYNLIELTKMRLLLSDGPAVGAMSSVMVMAVWQCTQKAGMITVLVLFPNTYEISKILLLRSLGILYNA